jgi:hypothetical protein
MTLEQAVEYALNGEANGQTALAAPKAGVA